MAKRDILIWQFERPAPYRKNIQVRVAGARLIMSYSCGNIPAPPENVCTSFGLSDSGVGGKGGNGKEGGKDPTPVHHVLLYFNTYIYFILFVIYVTLL